MKDSFRNWLERQGHAFTTINAQLHRAGRVEKHYGDLDEHYDEDELQSVIADLRYSTADERQGRPNPSKIPFKGDPRSHLASYRHAVEKYCRFRRETDGEEVFGDEDASPEPVDGGAEHRQLVGLERDMQTSLRRALGQLEPDLQVADDGAERRVASGFIDITARDAQGALVVIGLKTGTAGQQAVAQVLSYMGDLSDEEAGEQVRGILVAGGFDAKARAAARMVPSLALRVYRVSFEFTEPED